LAVVSAESGEGRTRLAANLAVSLAQLGRRTLLIDADLRRPRQHQVFDLPGPHGGLAALLADPSAAEAIQAVDDMAPLFVLPSGTVPAHPLELLESPGFTALLAELSQRFDHILLDTPAYTAGSDVLAICARCQASLLVVRPQHTRTRHARALIDALRHSGTLMLGTVIHDF
jgi:capsular exopolysaccharide synthesis family protein